jgi:hydrogenase assembly chaperone HypC/HupF
MCLGELGRVREVAADGSLVVDRESRSVNASVMLLDEPPDVGDWVLMHSGFVLEVLTDEEAHDALRLRSGQEEEPV